MRKGITKYHFVPTVAALAAPTVANITAGTALTGQIAETNGFMFSNSPIQTPDMDSTFVSQIPGEDTSEDSGLVFYEDKATNPIRTALAKGTNGYIVIFAAGYAGASPAASDKCEVWPVTVSSNSRKYSSGNEAAQYEVKFACTAPPAQDAVVAA
jgi:hypothetical protein